MTVEGVFSVRAALSPAVRERMAAINEVVGGVVLPAVDEEARDEGSVEEDVEED